MIVYENFDLTNYNSYKIQSFCKKAIFPKSEQEFIEIFSVYSEEELVILGNGNNTLLSKPRYDKVFIILNGCFNNIDVDGKMIMACAGATLLELSKIALESNLTGAEFLYDIPSSVGGAVVMNAGTKEGETKDILHKVRYFDVERKKIIEKESSELDLKYRSSFFQNNNKMIVLKAWFALDFGEYKSIEINMLKSKERRWLKQPRNYPNCGSVFKRPSGRFVGPMLDELGLKGYTIGGAQVSEKHSGFIINIGAATGQDILDLISHIKKLVFNKFQIELEIEQRII